MINKILDFAFSGFWPFIGIAVLFIFTSASFVAIINLLFRMWNRIIRHLNIRSKGWPPAHCDADGDFKNENKDG